MAHAVFNHADQGWAVFRIVEAAAPRSAFNVGASVAGAIVAPLSAGTSVASATSGDSATSADAGSGLAAGDHMCAGTRLRELLSKVRRRGSVLE